MVIKKINPSFIIIVFFAMMAVGLIGSVSLDRTSGDFDVYYETSQNYLAKTAIYNPHVGIEEFKYSPLFALFFSPFVLFNKLTALYLWSILNVLLFYAMFYFLYKLKLISFNKIKDIFIVICLFAFTGRYIFANIKIGQVNMLLCFLLVLTMYFEINKKYFLAAIFLAFSLMIKFFPLLFLIYYILRRKFKIVAYTVLFVAIFLFLPAIYSGINLNFSYLKEWLSLLKSTPATIYYSAKNYSLLAFFSWFFVSRLEPMFILNYRFITKGLTPQVYLAWFVSCAALFSLYFYDSVFKKEKEEEIVYFDYAGLFVCMLLFNPLAYLNALFLLIIPYLIILRYLFSLNMSKKWIWLVSVITVFSFILSMAYNKAFFSDIEKFYASLQYKLPMWAIIFVYLGLWIAKFSLIIKSNKNKSSI